MVLIQSSPLPKIVFTSLFVCVYRVFGENAVCYNSDSLYVGNCAPVRKWWNWQTHHLEGVAPKGVGVQIPPSAPSVHPALNPKTYSVLPNSGYQHPRFSGQTQYWLTGEHHDCERLHPRKQDPPLQPR